MWCLFDLLSHVIHFICSYDGLAFPYILIQGNVHNLFHNVHFNKVLVLAWTMMIIRRYLRIDDFMYYSRISLFNIVPY